MPVEKAYAALTKGEGIPADSAVAAVENSYADGKTDEFVPTLQQPRKSLQSDGNSF